MISGSVTYTLHVGLLGTGAVVGVPETVPVGTESTPLALAPGDYSFTVHYSGDSNYKPSDGPVEPFTIKKAPPSIDTTVGLTNIPGFGAGQFATIGFWHNNNGQAVINSFNGGPTKTFLGNWLATNFPHLFGTTNPYIGATLTSLGKTSLAGMTNAQVASVYLNLWTPSGVTKNTYVQAFAVALGLYADTQSLGGQSLLDNGLAAQYGFVVTASGAGAFGVGNDGSAFGVPNGTPLPILQILQIADSNFASATGNFYSSDQAKTSQANDVLNNINSIGDIPGGGAFVGGTTKLTDSATLSGGSNPTGTITFYLFAPGVTPNGTNSNNVYTDTVTVSGNGTYSTNVGNNPGGYTPLATGTYQWVAIYSGDSNNSSAISAFGSEPQPVGSDNPALNTIPGGTVVIGSGSKLTDLAMLAGGTSPTGTITFYLFAPGVTPNGAFSNNVYSDTVTVNGNGTYTTASGNNPGGFLPTTVGTYQWVAIYSGDSNNSLTVSPYGDEPEIVSPTCPTISTTPSPANVTLSGSSQIIKDAATLAGGYSATGSITFTLYNPSHQVVDTETVTVNGNGTYTTPVGYTLTAGAATGIYQWNATYTPGNGNNNGASDINNPNEQVSVLPAPISVSISGHKYLDVCGDGFSPDDYNNPLGGVTIKLFKDASPFNGVLDAGDGSAVQTTTTANVTGAYSFGGLTAGTYFVQEIVPGGFVRTGPTMSTYYVVKVTSAGVVTATDPSDNSAVASNKLDFDDAETCDKTILTCYSFKINNCTTVGDLRGYTHEGDTVTVTFTVAANAQPHDFTLVSYTAPGATFDANVANQQKIFDIDTGTFGPGVHTLTVTIPNCYYQVDFVCGCAIDQFGPASSNIFYSAQNRLFSADNGGTHTCQPLQICGKVYRDDNVNCKQDLATECFISGVPITLCNASGQTVCSTTTGSNGSYCFTNVPAGTYTICEGQPTGYVHSGQSVGWTTCDGNDMGQTCGSADNRKIKVTVGGNDKTHDNNFFEHVSVSGNSQTSQIAANFGSGSLAAGKYLWFNAAATPTGVSNGTVIHIANSTISFKVSTTQYTLAVPDATITFVASGTQATTSFDSVTNSWVIKVPIGLSGNFFMDGLAYQIPSAGLPANISNVTWKGDFFGNTTGAKLNWKWGAALYTSSLGADYNALGVKPVDSSTASAYKNSDVAGTPESKKASFSGSGGTGGSSYTGNYSGSTQVTASPPPQALMVGSSGVRDDSLSTLGNVITGVYHVTVDGLDNGKDGRAEQARIDDALATLNGTLGAFGVTLTSGAGDANDVSTIHIHLASSCVLGSSQDGVLGVTSGTDITLVTGWNYYLGANAAGIGAGQFDFQTVVSHEIGHALGLGHSADLTSVMYPYLSTADVRRDFSATDLSALVQCKESGPEALMANNSTAAQNALAHPSGCGCSACAAAAAQAVGQSAPRIESATPNLTLSHTPVFAILPQLNLAQSFTAIPPVSQQPIQISGIANNDWMRLTVTDSAFTTSTRSTSGLASSDNLLALATGTRDLLDIGGRRDASVFSLEFDANWRDVVTDAPVSENVLDKVFAAENTDDFSF
ncbi:MAG TPA: SdrD B-like domain-containing protein [Gemmataceae bacterium]|nr:SdrD B-like domain-containing protein [Gemmataceae bacterium]